MMRLICILLIFFILIPLSNAHGLSTNKRVASGKLSLILILFGIGVLTKYLIHSDQNQTRIFRSVLRTKIGQPDRVIEYHKGFDRWRIEWYGKKQYKFRNGILVESVDSTQP